MPKSTYTAHELAEHCKIPVKKIEQYTKLGIFPLATFEQTAIYHANDFAWLKELYALESAGFSPQELLHYTEWVLQDKRQNHEQDNEALRKIVTIFEQKLASTNEQINHLYEIHETLFHQWAKWDFLYQQQQEKQLIKECMETLKAHGKFPN